MDWKLRPQSTTRDAYALGSSLPRQPPVTNRRMQRVQHPAPSTMGRFQLENKDKYSNWGLLGDPT